MGLWETVYAFGPDFKETDFNSPNSRHLYQICNINKVFHAMALDDNRPQLYTPILLTGRKIISNCPDINVNDIVEEVWFSGAHSDVGGGMKKSVIIPNTSLKWMLSRFERYNLFEGFSDTIKTNNMTPITSMKPWFNIAVKIKSRDIGLYYDSTSSFYNHGRLKIHRSVIERIEDGRCLPTFKISRKYARDWFDQCPFVHCFTKEGDKRKFDPACKCIQIITDDIK